MVVAWPYRNVTNPFVRYAEARLREPAYRQMVVVLVIEAGQGFERLLVYQNARSIMGEFAGRGRMEVVPCRCEPRGLGR